MSSKERLSVTLTVEELEALVTRCVERVIWVQEQKRTVQPKLVSVDEAAQSLRCSTRTVRRLIALGRLRSAKLNTGSSRVLIRRDDLEALLKDSEL